MKDFNSSKRFLIDTGADISIIPAVTFHKFKQPDSRFLYAANGTPIKTYGLQLHRIDFHLRRPFDFEFIVADVTHPIIGADFLSKFGLLVDLKNRQLSTTFKGYFAENSISTN